MNEDNLKLQLFSFVEKLITIENESNKAEFDNWKGSSSHLGVIDLSDKFVETPIVVTQRFSDLSDLKIYIMINNLKYGFKESDYKPFYKLVYEISQWNNIQSKVSIEYLKENILKWIVDIYITNISKIDIFTYLENILFKDVKKYTYYFPVLNIDIEQNFYIGKSRIIFFSKEYFDEFYKKKSIDDDCSEKDFNEMYRKYQGQVFVESCVYAENKKAESIAYDNSCFIVDILKCCSPTVQFPTEKCYLELESRMPFSYDFLRFENNDIYDFSINTKINRSQLPFYSKLITALKPFFDEFAKLLDPKFNTDLQKLVKNSIIFYSKCMSEIDLHLRVSQFIMIIESILLLDDEKYKMEHKCKKRFLEYSFAHRNSEKLNFKEILDDMYQVRHKMTHKSIRIFIDYSELAVFQGEIINLFYLLLTDENGFENKESLINALDTLLAT